MKDIEELKSWFEDDKLYVGEYVNHKINQLDEPETLSQEITYKDALKVIAENIDTDEFSIGLHLEALNNNEKYEFLTEKWIECNTSPVDDEGRLYVWKRDLQNLLVPKQELPVIPKFVADWIEEIKPDNSLRVAFEYIAQRKAKDHDDPLAFWIEEGSSETFARAWLDGYTVEEEPLYHALIKGHELVDDYDVYWNYHKSNHDVFVSRLHPPLDNFTTEMTKQEWFEIGINDSNADFVNVDE